MVSVKESKPSVPCRPEDLNTLSTGPNISTSFTADTEVADAGLYTTVFLVIRRSASFQVGIARGEFHGVINVTTSMGRLTM